MNKITQNMIKICKRGKRNSIKSVEKDLTFAGVNPDGAMSKLTTIRKVIMDTNASVWMMQETKVSNQGKIRFDGYITYGHTRIEKEGGGLALSSLEEL